MLVFGMTEFGLSADRDMKMNIKEAAQFIKMYMGRFPGVRVYMDEQIAFSRTHGYVTTMFNHRRPIPDINHPNKRIRQAAENQSINTPIQGTAADIIRLAMVNIRREIPTRAPYLTSTIQIHDELKYQCPVEYAIEGCKFIQEVMERPIPGFSEIMPIKAEPDLGKIWGHSLDLKFKPDGTAYVKPKATKNDPTDVTYDMIDYALPLYKLAGIQVL